MSLSFTKSTQNLEIGTSMIETFEGTKIQESDIQRIFGTPSNDNSENKDKGYGGEWYFVASTGSVYGVGFRFGTMRTRGKAFGLNEKEYAEFLNWLRGELVSCFK